MSRKRLPGEGTIYFDKNRGTYVGQADAGTNPKTGKRRRIKVRGQVGESQSSVAKRLRQRIEELEGSGDVRTVEDLLRKWKSRGMPGPKPKSEKTKAGLWSRTREQILPVLGPVPAGALTVDEIEDFLGARVDSHSRSTLIKLRGVLRQAYDFGVGRDYVRKNPARLTVLPHDAEQKRYARDLSDEELELFLKVASDHRLGAWAVVTAHLALRPGEAYGLCWDVIDFDQGTITIRRQLKRGSPPALVERTKTGVVRALKMPSEVEGALHAHREQSEWERRVAGDRWPSEWADLVFVSEAGTPMNDSNVRRLVSRWADRAGIGDNLTPYDLRHTATTRLYERGASRDELVDLLGHKTTRMVDSHYLHRDGLVVTAAADLWDDD